MALTLFDGVDCPGGRALFPLDDPALHAGLGVFETMRTYGGRIFRLERHLARLVESARHVGIACDGPLGEEAERAAAAVHGESQVNVTLTMGGHRIVRSMDLDLARVGRPVRVATRPWVPSPWLPGWVKHTSRAPWVLAVRDAGVDEVLFASPDGHWTEANRSNLFVVRGGVVRTPPDDGRILRGVTREALIEAARGVGIPVREEPVAVGPCEEMWLSSTLKELAPVVELDGAPMGCGPVGEAVIAAFRISTRGPQSG